MQNDAMWPMLRDIARQLDWPVMADGRMTVRKLPDKDWKHIMTAALEKQQTMAQGIDGGWVLLGQETKKFSIKKMRDLLDLIKLFGDSKDIKWTAPKAWEQYLDR